MYSGSTTPESFLKISTNVNLTVHSSARSHLLHQQKTRQRQLNRSPPPITTSTSPSLFTQKPLGLFLLMCSELRLKLNFVLKTPLLMLLVLITLRERALYEDDIRGLHLSGASNVWHRYLDKLRYSFHFHFKCLSVFLSCFFHHPGVPAAFLVAIHGLLLH